jgi:hypothetical protein
MGRRPVIAKQYRHFGNAELALSAAGADLHPRHRSGKHGILKPNSRMLPHIRSAASFLHEFLAWKTSLSIGHCSIRCAKTGEEAIPQPPQN